MQYRQDRGVMVPVRVHTVVISVQHDESVTLEQMHAALKEQVVKAVVPSKYLDKDTIYHLQPSGRFVIGGPQVSGEHATCEMEWMQILFLHLDFKTVFFAG